MAPGPVARSSAPSRVSWNAIFGNDNPVHLEIGSGNGAFILRAAEKNPGLNFFGVEKRRSKADRVVRRIHAAGLINAIVINADAVCLVETLLADESVDTYHIYFPDPWPKRRHRRRRLFGAGPPRLAAEMARTLRPGGCVHLASDVESHLAAIVDGLLSTGRFRATDPPEEPLVTDFSRKYAREGRALFRACLFKA